MPVGLGPFEGSRRQGDLGARPLQDFGRARPSLGCLLVVFRDFSLFDFYSLHNNEVDKFNFKEGLRFWCL